MIGIGEVILTIIVACVLFRPNDLPQVIIVLRQIYMAFCKFKCHLTRSLDDLTTAADSSIYHDGKDIRNSHDKSGDVDY